MDGVIGFAGWFWLHWFWVLAFPVCIYLKMVHWRRLNRGKIRRWLTRNWGFQGLMIPNLFAMGLLFTGLGCAVIGQARASAFVLAVYWTATFVMDVVDYITGGDDPGRRLKKLASALAKKLTWAPAPRPVIDLRMT